MSDPQNDERSKWFEHYVSTLGAVDASSTSGPLRVGSKVRTAGGKTSNAPANIPVGTVSRVRTQSGTSSLVVEIEPGHRMRCHLPVEELGRTQVAVGVDGG